MQNNMPEGWNFGGVVRVGFWFMTYAYASDQTADPGVVSCSARSVGAALLKLDNALLDITG